MIHRLLGGRRWIDIDLKRVCSWLDCPHGSRCYLKLASLLGGDTTPGNEAGCVMGARNVAACFAQHAQLKDQAFRLLIHMALRSLDTAHDGRPARVYFGGRDAMAEALGVVASEAGYQSVKRALRELVAAGAIDRTLTGGGGRRSEYRLNLAALPEDESEGQKMTPSEGQKMTPSEGQKMTPSEGQKMTFEGVRIRPPKEDRGTTEESPQEKPLVRQSSHLRADPRPGDDEIYMAAKKRLMALGPDIYPIYLSQAADEGHQDLHTQMIRADELAQA